MGAKILRGSQTFVNQDDRNMEMMEVAHHRGTRALFKT